MPKFLIVDDDVKLAEMIKDWLEDEGDLIEVVHDGHDALNIMRSFGHDVIVLDWDLPGLSGPEICTRYRQAGGTVPILMLTAKGAIEEKEKGFLAGADDYLTKPFHPRELSLRLRALVARAAGTNLQTGLKVGNLVLDMKTGSASVNENSLKLTAREFALLEHLMRHQGQIFNAGQLLSSVWESEADFSEASVRMCVSRLREKLAQHDQAPQIETVSGFGYRLN